MLSRRDLGCAPWRMAPAWCQADGNAPRFEVKNYVITAELLPSQHLLSAKARVDIVPTTDLTALAFELHSNLRVEKVVDTTGQEVSFSQDGQALNLSLLNPMPGRKARLPHRNLRRHAEYSRWQPGGRHLKSPTLGPKDPTFFIPAVGSLSAPIAGIASPPR